MPRLIAPGTHAAILQRNAEWSGLALGLQVCGPRAYLQWLPSTLAPPQAAIAGARDAAKVGDMGGGQQRTLIECVPEQPLPSLQHGISVGPAHHPVGMLDLDGMV